jgi:hypothetical protein
VKNELWKMQTGRGITVRSEDGEFIKRSRTEKGK